MPEIYNPNATQGTLERYQCPSCGGPMNFDAASGGVLCQSCGNRMTVEAAKALQKQGHSDTDFNWGDYKSGLSQNGKLETNVYQCQSCGAMIECDASTAATTCPYCGNNVVLSDRVDSGIKPNYIIPFKIQKKDLPALISNFYKKKRLLPKDFFSANNIGKSQGIYVPFWFFNCGVEGGLTMNASTSTSYSEGDYDCVRTDHYLLEREGSMLFDKIPVDASTKMDDDLMDSIEPYDYSELVPFNSAYLAGYVADRFNSDPDTELPRADRRMMNSAFSAFSSTAGAYSVGSIQANNLHVAGADCKYAMLPVYLLHCEYAGKTYRYAINGQTGKVVGELPISKAKAFGWFMGLFAGASVVISAVLSIIRLMGR